MTTMMADVWISATNKTEDKEEVQSLQTNVLSIQMEIMRGANAVTMQRTQIDRVQTTRMTEERNIAPEAMMTQERKIMTIISTTTNHNKKRTTTNEQTITTASPVSRQSPLPAL